MEGSKASRGPSAGLAALSCALGALLQIACGDVSGLATNLKRSSEAESSTAGTSTAGTSITGTAAGTSSAGASSTGARGSSTGRTSSGTSSSASTTTGSSSAGTSSTSGGTTGGIVTPGNPGVHDFLFALDSTATSHAISPYIYGTNQGDLTAEAKGLALTRMGGNRLTAYNWETNASNAGSDYLYENDAFFSGADAGLAMSAFVQAAQDSAASVIMTVPIAGWVAADESGPCPSNPTQTQIAARFEPILPAKGAAFVYPPDTTDGKVYADEFVSWLESAFPKAQTDDTRRIFYMLDNEPDLWSATHAEIHPSAVTYAELVKDNLDFATAIKGVAPKAIVFGAVNYGFEGYVNLQMAPDAMSRDWLNFYLDNMQAGDQDAGQRLVDVLDVHWYPEATGGGNRVTGDGVSAAEVAARVQAPRSLWDTTYSENSWIEGYIGGPIALLPLLSGKIAAHYPGTKLSISEYNYGAGGDISGGVAQADVLGIFGVQDLFAAAMWELSKNTFIFGAFAMYRDYDGKGATFGDTSISATNADFDKSSVYGSVSSSDPTNVVAVVINKDPTSSKVAGITIKHTALKAADVYVLTSASSTPKKGTGLTAVAANAFSYKMPPMSVTTLVFHP